MCETSEILSGECRPQSRDFLKESRWVTETVTEKQPKVYRYRDVWMRAFVKIKAGSSVTRLGKEIHLFGANILREDPHADTTQAEALVRKMTERSRSLVETPILNTSVISPSSPFRLVWSFVYILLMIYTALVMPFRMAFYEDSAANSWFVLDNVINALFFCDILFTLNTAFYNAEGTLVTSRKAIFLTYLKTWLIVDLTACIPFNSFGAQDSNAAGSSNQVSALMKLMRLPRLYRLVRLARLFTAIRRNQHSRIFDYLQELVSLKHGSLRLIIFLMTVSLSLHLMACLWFFIASIEGMTPDTWVVQKSLQDASAVEQYISSLYWAMTTLATVGYGDIVPGTITEKVVAMVWMLFGVCFFSFVVSSLSNMLNSVDTKQSLLAGKLAALDEFAEEAKLAKDLRFRLRHALRYSTIHTGFSTQVKRGIFSELPRNLRFEVAMAMHHGAAKTVPFFADRDQAFVAATVPFLNSLQMSDQDVVYTIGDYADEMYFIWQGYCAIMYQDLVMKKLQRGSYFGEVEVFLLCTRKFTVQAIFKTELLSMNKKVLAVIQNDFPSVYQEMHEVALVRNKLNERMQTKYKEVFLQKPKQPVRTHPRRVRRDSVLANLPCTKLSTDERLDEIEQSVKDIRGMVSSVLEAQRVLLQTLATQSSSITQQESETFRSTSPIV